MEVIYSPTKGLNPVLRPRIWMHLAHIDTIFHKHSPLLYEKLREIKGPYESSIKCDVYRTFPYHEVF
jgi:hypothetical protein